MSQLGLGIFLNFQQNRLLFYKSLNRQSSMKMKQKPLVYQSQERQINEQRTLSKRSSCNENRKNHFPLSSIREYQSMRYESNWKEVPRTTMKSSPYMQLPSVGSERKDMEANWSKMSESNSYEKNFMAINSRPQSRNSVSIYEQIVDVDVGYEEFTPSQNVRKNRSRIQNNQPMAMQQLDKNIPVDLINKNQLPQAGGMFKKKSNTPEESQYNMLDRKFERVCEKIENLSREKYHGSSRLGDNCDSRKENIYLQANTVHKNGKKGWQKGKNSLEQQSQSTISTIRDDCRNERKLCYSSIVYEPLSVFCDAQHSNLSVKDNYIQQRISAVEPSIISIYEEKIIEMERRLGVQSGKILRLEEEVLREREGLIRREKEWLLRENQLLQWVEESQKELERWKMLFQQLQYTKSFKNQQKSDYPLIRHNEQNVFVIDSSPLDSPVRRSQFVGSRVKGNHQTLQSGDLKDQQTKCLNNNKAQSEMMLGRVFGELLPLLEDVMKVVKTNQDWVRLMSRVPDEMLDGTLYRVKEEMNSTQSLLDKIKQQSVKIVNNYDKYSFPPTNVQRSQVFLLESYCPPSSQQYKIPPKGRLSQNKHTRRNHSFSISQSRSTTDKKSHSIDVHRRKSSRNKQTQQALKGHKIDNIKKRLSDKVMDSYCEEVFYEGGCMRVVDQLQEIKLKQTGGNYELYQLISLQAMAIESIIDQNPSVFCHFQQEDNLLTEEDGCHFQGVKAIA